MLLAEEIVNIGVAMTDLINTNCSLTITGSETIDTGLGRYLTYLSTPRDAATKAKFNPDNLWLVAVNPA